MGEGRRPVMASGHESSAPSSEISRNPTSRIHATNVSRGTRPKSSTTTPVINQMAGRYAMAAPIVAPIRSLSPDCAALARANAAPG